MSFQKTYFFSHKNEILTTTFQQTKENVWGFSTEITITYVIMRVRILFIQYTREKTIGTTF